MKKLVLAIQVLGAIAVLPLYVIVEFNHGTNELPVLDSTSIIVKKQGDSSTQSRVKRETVVFGN